jgi:ABC-type amino acid transport system permease subunit
MPGTLANFLPLLLSGFVVNLQIGGAVVVIALILGVPLSLVRRRIHSMRRPVGAAVGLMQAIPTYVAMFFILNWLPRDLTIFEMRVTSFLAVVLSLSIYMTAYVAENADEALAHWERHDRERAMLFLPNLLRGFTVVLMSSGFAAAVGVSEAVSVTMHQAERLPRLPDRIALFAVAIAFFVAVIWPLNLLGRELVKRLIGRYARGAATAPAASMDAV